MYQRVDINIFERTAKPKIHPNYWNDIFRFHAVLGIVFGILVPTGKPS